MPQSRVEREDPNTIVERHIVAHGQGAEMSHEKLDDFLESLNGHHVKLFVAMVAEMGGAFTQIIPLTGDGLVDERHSLLHSPTAHVLRVLVIQNEGFIGIVLNAVGDAGHHRLPVVEPQGDLNSGVAAGI